ncbi:MAG TPA: chromate transporter, partial [Clostridiales bacterium]|nr:chromate transporter [Clostridiales bacterium]
MMYLRLFLTFLKIGVVSFGGGYGMISVIRDTVLSQGMLTEEELMNFIGVAESTPGPIAINMATFIGSAKGGFLGALLATLGVVLPAFIIILIIAAVLKNLLKYKPVQGFLGGVRPAVAALIIGTALLLGLR